MTSDQGIDQPRAAAPAHQPRIPAPAQRLNAPAPAQRPNATAPAQRLNAPAPAQRPNAPAPAKQPNATAPAKQPTGFASARRTLAVAGTAHALHDGYTDLIYVLLPLWQAEFGLGYGMLAALRGLYAGTMAALQIPSGWLVERMDGRIVLAIGTALAAAGYALAGLTGSLVGLCAALAISGAGSSTQHPIASAAVSRLWSIVTRPAGDIQLHGGLRESGDSRPDVAASDPDAMARRALAARRARCSRSGRGASVHAADRPG
jgi:hypothetical protein